MIEMRLLPSSKRAFIAIGQSPMRARSGIRQAFYFIGKDNVKRARQEISNKSAKSGRTYLVRLNGRLTRHRASAPGEFPARLTGALNKSIDFEVQGSDQMEFGATAPYAGFLEDGTSKMAPRPFLKKTTDLTRRDAINYVANQMKMRLGQ